MSKKPQLHLILITAFLDILGMSLLIPSFPAITAHFHQAESWSIWTQAIYSLGMFLSGTLVGKSSDIYGRKNMLLLTTLINIL
jgi:MFS family permease